MKNAFLTLFVISTQDNWGIHLDVAKNANLPKIVLNISLFLILIFFFFLTKGTKRIFQSLFILFLFFFIYAIWGLVFI